MFLHRLAAGLTFVLGLGLLRLAVGWESWPVLALGLSACVTGLAWFVLAGPPGRGHSTSTWVPARHG